ncbi:MAG: ATP-binding protein [Candidatus Aureabacteria bacterium]|nr:ATP-binding protein [Candidatus Auribacterota bacterium]
MKMRIRTKMLLSFMAMVALIVALIVFALVSIHIMSESNRQLVCVQEKESLVADLQATIDRAVTALGDYLVSGKRARRSTFIQLVGFYRRQVEALELFCKSPRGDGGTGLEAKKISELKAELKTIDVSSREILALADKIEGAQGHKLIQNVVSTVKGAMDKKGARAEKGTPGGELNALEDLLGVSTRDAQERLKELELLSATISESESRLRELSLQLMRAKEHALEKIGEIREIAQREGMMAVEMAALADRQAGKFMRVGAVIILTCGLVLALYLSSSFSRPILDLDRGARLIGEGNFDHRLKLETGNELEELASRFNTMASRLKASYGALEEKVRDRTRELEQSNQQLRRLFDGISDGISIIDREYRIVNANTGIAAMVKRGEGELIGGACYRSYNGSDSPCPGCPAESTFRDGRASVGQLRWCAPGQKVKDMQLYIFPLQEEEGRVVQVIEYAKDISEKVALEQKLFQSAKLAGIGTLAAGVAHEIRNPLGIMKTSADMIKRSCQEGEQNYELAGFLIEEVDRLNRVVTRLLNFAKPSKPNIEPCGINDIMDRALALVGPQHRLQDMEVVREYTHDLPGVPGDREQLCQVFLNLIINAIQAMPKHGRLTLATGMDEGEAVWAGVTDTGEGIDARIVDSIFDPFFTTKDDGSGLGLAIAYRIVESHGGRLEVKSNPGKGTTFAVVLPVA